MLRDVDSTLLRIGIGIAMALSGATTLLWSVGKPPEWSPRLFGRAMMPFGFIQGRNRVRLYGLAIMAFGIGAALFWGVIAR
jgi:nitrogen fixation-related uncharacterized protein